ncbi:hypothetical protein ONZ51_g9682 [Trametes cubensis]|uniref:Uncharacterized protein n=1 Tax=Trametes cubensis TaxID=1111947 RepID=A0AAD7TLC0_9APHY|nr:hypothetical protein ONZ51_g9682 [Trametes cubensis]
MIPSHHNQRGAEKRDGDKATDPYQAPAFRPLTPPESPRRPLGNDSNTHAAVHQLLTSSQSTLNHIQRIVRIVSDQTHAAAAFKTVLRAADEIERLEVEVRSHCEAQDAAIEKAKVDVREAVENQITQTLRPRVTQMVADTVGQVVEDCVQTALDVLIQQQMKDEIDRYRRRILEVKTMLADAETRRRNERHQRETRSTAVQDVEADSKLTLCFPVRCARRPRNLSGLETTPASAATSVPATSPAPVATSAPAAAPAFATAPVSDTAAHASHAASAPEATSALDAAVAPDSSVPVPDTTPRPKTTPAFRPTPTLSPATPALDPTPFSCPSSPHRLPGARRGAPPACIDGRDGAPRVDRGVCVVGRRGGCWRADGVFVTFSRGGMRLGQRDARAWKIGRGYGGVVYEYGWEDRIWRFGRVYEINELFCDSY